jgi:hypothetical protein
LKSPPIREVVAPDAKAHLCGGKTVSEFWSLSNPVWLIPMVAIVAGCLTGILCTMAESWRKVRVAEMDAALKQQMLDRGWSAEEIQRVLKLSSSSEDRSRSSSSKGSSGVAV